MEWKRWRGLELGSGLWACNDAGVRTAMELCAERFGACGRDASKRN